MRGGQGIQVISLWSELYLNSHIAHDGSLVALEGLGRDVTYLFFTFAHELLAGSMQHLLILTLDLHLEW